MLRMRAPYALVAALLLVALIAAIVVGTAFYRGWSAPHEPIHAGARLPTLEELESRPWQHQLVTSSAQCAGSEINGHKLQDGEGEAGGCSLTLSLFFVTGFPYCQVPASIASFISSCRARIRHSRRSLSFRTRTPGAVVLNESQATPSCTHSCLALFRIAASLISVTAEITLAV